MGAGITCIVVGVFFLIIFGAFKRVPNMKKCHGIIVSTEYNYVPGEKNTWYANAQYFVDGKEYYIKSKYSSMGMREGKKVKIKYNSKKPEEAIIVPDKSLYIGTLVFIIFGIYAILSTLGSVPSIFK